jgi:myo-inositol-1(or 4)-monophosphatase
MHELADASGAAVLPHFRRPLSVENKGGMGSYDPVTAADRSAERAIRRLIAQRFPDHAIEGEEYGATSADSPYRWLIDPIDGTRAFVMGLPLWGTLIGLTRSEEPLLGMMDQPFTRERFWSHARGASLRTPDGKERRLKTRPCPSLADAMLSTTHPELFAPGLESRGFASVKQQVRSCRYGGDCYAYTMLAAGHIDLVMEAGLKPYDIVALIPIIERAGGRVTTWAGTPASAGGRILACGDPRLHERVLELLN